MQLYLSAMLNHIHQAWCSNSATLRDCDRIQRNAELRCNEAQNLNLATKTCFSSFPCRSLLPPQPRRLGPLIIRTRLMRDLRSLLRYHWVHQQPPPFHSLHLHTPSAFPEKYGEKRICAMSSHVGHQKILRSNGTSYLIQSDSSGVHGGFVVSLHSTFCLFWAPVFFLSCSCVTFLSMNLRVS